MTKEEVLQKVNDYCTEKQYTEATLTEAFKDKFADHFLKANAEGDINDESVLANMRFALNTAFSSASEMATVKGTEFVTKENDYKRQIEELQKKKKDEPSPKNVLELPDDVKEQLNELKAFKEKQTKQEKLGSILKIAKKDIRTDLHSSFDRFAADYEVEVDSDEREQAKYLTERFQEIFKDSIGDVRPKKPIQTRKQEEDYINSIPELNVK